VGKVQEVAALGLLQRVTEHGEEGGVGFEQPAVAVGDGDA